MTLLYALFEKFLWQTHKDYVNYLWIMTKYSQQKIFCTGLSEISENIVIIKIDIIVKKLFIFCEKSI